MNKPKSGKPTQLPTVTPPEIGVIFRQSHDLTFHAFTVGLSAQRRPELALLNVPVIFLEYAGDLLMCLAETPIEADATVTLPAFGSKEAIGMRAVPLPNVSPPTLALVTLGVNMDQVATCSCKDGAHGPRASLKEEDLVDDLAELQDELDELDEPVEYEN